MSIGEFKIKHVSVSHIVFSRVSRDFLFQRNLTLKGGRKEFSSEIPWKASTNAEDALTLTLSGVKKPDMMLYQAFSIHPPEEPSTILTNEDIIEFDGGKVIEVLITPQVITTDQDLVSFDIEDRLCYLDGERSLKFFKQYTVKNCQIECFSNFSAEICGCVTFDIVRDPSTPICELHEYVCVGDLRRDMKLSLNASCNCLQNCNVISYDFEILDNRFADR